MALRLIVAVNEDGCIDGFRPPRTDLQRFQALTIGCPVIMGRKTWMDLVAQGVAPLKHRWNIVVTRDRRRIAGNVPQPDDVYESVPAALGAFSEAWIIGGGEIYRQAMHLCKWLFVTHCNGRGGRVKFPAVSAGGYFSCVLNQKHDDHQFLVWKRSDAFPLASR